VARVFSGIQPTGQMHLGNYLGAVRRWVDEQPAAGSEAAANHDAVFCVVDLHALSAPYDPAELTDATRRLATILLAAGLDPQRCLLFVQSHVRAHTELTWLLNCTATYGELRRMTQFKEKSRGQDSVSVGLFDYPVLMASDILLYNTDEVPVGDDQRQHVELTRDIAVRFNHQFGDVFTIPKATFPPFGARIMDLQQPTKKMSKSEESPQGTILVLDDPKATTKKIKSAVTDSETIVRHDRDAKPGISNLIEIHGAVTGQTIAAVEREFGDGGYGTFKGAVAEAVVEYLRPLQARFQELDADRAEVERHLATGAGIAASIADPVLTRATAAAGLLPRASA
jgi:tryptophanyl-tRNA synthetase